MSRAAVVALGTMAMAAPSVLGGCPKQDAETIVQPYGAPPTPQPDAAPVPTASAAPSGSQTPGQ